MARIAPRLRHVDAELDRIPAVRDYEDTVREALREDGEA